MVNYRQSKECSSGAMVKRLVKDGGGQQKRETGKVPVSLENVLIYQAK